MKRQIYISDSKHNETFVGRWLWIYRSKGWIDVNEDGMMITSGSLKLCIKHSDIEEFTLGTFHRTAKPIPLHYIEIRYQGESQMESIYVVPFIPNKSPWLTTVWTMNKNTLSFLNLLKQSKQLTEQAVAPDS